jgi:hypothetical protein
MHWDDPRNGPEDVRTELPEVAYFLVGNGHISAALQYSPQQGTRIGLLVMDPEQLTPKRAALTMHPQLGLANTQLQLWCNGHSSSPQQCWVYWDEHTVVPAVIAEWEAPPLRVRERVYCPDRSTPRLHRRIELWAEQGCSVCLRTGVQEYTLEAQFRLSAHEHRELAVEYWLERAPTRLRCRWAPAEPFEDEAVQYWQRVARVESPVPLLQQLFRSACWQLPAVVAASGRMNTSLWEHTREHVRDGCTGAIGLVLSGHHEGARRVLERILRECTTADGAVRNPEESVVPELAPLDYNGMLLVSLYYYTCWTGDWALVRGYWERLRSVAEYPLRPQFRVERGFLLHNRREYWGRTPLHGVEDGIELAYQMWTVLGLEAAAQLAEGIGQRRWAHRWAMASVRLRRAMLQHPHLRLVEQGMLVKRRLLSGAVQQELLVQEHPAIPPEVPLRTESRHWLEPDATCALPIVWGVVEPDSELAQRTLDRLELLWNQRWEGGGYGRYHVSSESDSPGAYPLASLWIARAALRARREQVLWRVLEWLGGLPQARSGAWFAVYGWRPVPPCPQVGILAGNWSELVQLVVCDLLGIHADPQGVWVKPLLPRPLEWLRATLRWHDRQLDILLERTNVAAPVVLADSHPLPADMAQRWYLPPEAQQVRCLVP